MYNFFKKLLPLYIFVFISFFICVQNDETDNDNELNATLDYILYPSILTLLNQDLLMVASDGIYYFDLNYFPNYQKKITFESPIGTQTENKKTTMAQFSNKYNGYIIIIVKDIIYFLQQDGTEIKNVNLNDKISGNYYCLIPYKKEGNYLYYLISYTIDNNTFTLKYFKFNINSPYSNEIINTITISTLIMYRNSASTSLTGVYCNFLFNSILSKDILVCFYSVFHPTELQSRSFDPNNNFEELIDLFEYKTFPDTFEIFYHISAATNQDRKKAFLFFQNGLAYTMTFDFENKFSEYIDLTNDDTSGMTYEKDYSQQKLFYFKQTDEFLIGSKLYSQGCKIYLMTFNSNFVLKSKSFIDPVDDNNPCSGSNSFSIYYRQNYYFVVSDNNEKTKIVFKKANVLGFVEYVEQDDEDNQDTNKCKNSNTESNKYDLCISCNTEKGYFPVEIKDNSLFYGFVECYNENTKPANFYYNNIDNKYKICYETCLTCNEDGDEYNNNCLTCDNNHIKKPDFPNSKNCVTKCLYSYYYTSYGQYKCTNSSNCPDEANLYISELKKCTNDCSKENIYKYQYGGRCIENCPENTTPNLNNICIAENIEYCSKSETEIDLQNFLTSGGVDANAKIYAKEFTYTEKHISYFYNSQYSIILYKELNCIEELSINMPKVDFGDCYSKVQNALKPITKKIIIGLIERLNGQKKSTISYFFFHPITGEKLDVDTICKEEEIVIKENLISQLNTSSFDLNSILFLTEQDINIFNISDEFYKDICYHFESPNGKDVPVKERIHIYYPNITLCDPGCTNKGVNLTSMESICECHFSSILNNEYIEGNVLIESSIEEITDIISNSNLDVLKCFKDVFKKEYIKKGIGEFIIITIFIFQIIFSIIFLTYNMDQIRRYIYFLSEQYINITNKQNKEKKLINNINEVKIKEPPKKVKKTIKNKKSTYFRNEEIFDKGNSLMSGTELKKNKHSSRCKDNRKNNKKELKNNVLIFQRNTENLDNKLNMDEYFKTDLDDMDYDDAIKNDKRTFCVFLSDRLKEKVMVVDTFYNKNNIRPISIKILLLLLNIDLYFVINGLFFSEEYIIELYHLEEEDAFFSYIPRSINRFFYATMVSAIVAIIIDCIFIEEKKLKRILLREKGDFMQLRYEVSLMVKSIKKRYIIFIIVCFVISIFSWYYVSCFNNVYKGVKLEWIKSSITIIIIMQLLSVIITFLEGILRELSFSCKSEKVYKLKQFLS